MPPYHHSFYIRRWTFQRFTDTVFESGTVQGPTHTNYLVLRQISDLMDQVGHGIHWITHYNDGYIRRVLDQAGGNRLYNICIYTDKLFTSHSRFPWDPTGDHCNVTTCCFRIIVSASGYPGVETHKRCSLHQVHGFSFS